MQIEEYIEREYDELVKIRETLEDIEFILEYAHVPQYEDTYERDENCKLIRIREYLEAPLESLRIKLNTARQAQKIRTPVRQTLFE